MTSLVGFHARRAKWAGVGVIAFVAGLLSAQDVDLFWVVRRDDDHSLIIASYGLIAFLFGVFHAGVDQLPKLREFTRHRGRSARDLYRARWWAGFLLGPALLVAGTAAAGLLFKGGALAFRGLIGAWNGEAAIIEAGDILHWCVVATCSFSAYAFGSWIVSSRGPFAVAMLLRCVAFGALVGWTFVGMSPRPDQWFVPYWVVVAFHAVATAVFARDACMHWSARRDSELPLPSRRATSTIITTSASVVAFAALVVPMTQQVLLSEMPYPRIEHLSASDRFVLDAWGDGRWECDADHQRMARLREPADWEFDPSTAADWEFADPQSIGARIDEERLGEGHGFELGSRRIEIAPAGFLRLFMTVPDATLHGVHYSLPPTRKSPDGVPARRWRASQPNIGPWTHRIATLNDRQETQSVLFGNPGADELWWLDAGHRGVTFTPAPLPDGDRYVRWTGDPPENVPRADYRPIYRPSRVVIIGERGAYRVEQRVLVRDSQLSVLATAAAPREVLGEPRFDVALQDGVSPVDFTLVVRDAASGAERFRHHFAPHTFAERVQAGAIGALAVMRPLPLLLAGFVAPRPEARWQNRTYVCAWFTDPGVRAGEGAPILLIALFVNSALAFLLVRRLSRLGAERWRIVAWTAALVVAGPLAWPFYRGLEPGSAWVRRAITKPAPPRIVTAGASAIVGCGAGASQ